MSRRRLTALALGVVTLFSGFGSVGVGEALQAVAATAPSLSCGANHLSVQWRGTTGGLAGHGGDLFWIRNDGATVCRLSGYAVVGYQTRSGRVALTSTDSLGDAGARIGVYRGRLPVVELAARGGLASFWVFGEDVQPPCPNLASMVVTIPEVRGRAHLAPPKIYSSWPFCGPSVTVYPIVPGESGSLPPVPLRDEIMPTS